MQGIASCASHLRGSRGFCTIYPFSTTSFSLVEAVSGQGDTRQYQVSAWGSGDLPRTTRDVYH